MVMKIEERIQMSIGGFVFQICELQGQIETTKAQVEPLQKQFDVIRDQLQTAQVRNGELETQLMQAKQALLAAQADRDQFETMMRKSEPPPTPPKKNGGHSKKPGLPISDDDGSL